MRGKCVRSRWLSLVAIAVVALDPLRADAATAVVTPDGRRTLISRDVGVERWAITRNSAEDGTVTGNVFAGAGDPLFVWCEDASSDGSSDVVDLSCFGASRCLASPCEVQEWSFIADVSLAASFFAAAGGIRWESAGPPVTIPASFLEPPPAGAMDVAGAGVQLSRDGRRILISKDVGPDRWAITSNQDGTVTGNVFPSSGGEPQFLWCTESSRTGDAVTIDCQIAATATFGPIADEEGNFFVNALTGDDGNPGSPARPFRTVQGAIDALPQTGGDVYVAGGRYLGMLELRSRVSLYGSFDPSTWIRDRERFPSFIEGGQDDAFAVRGRGLAVATIDGFTIAASEPSSRFDGASVPILLEEAVLVTVSSNTIIASDASDGADGEDGSSGAAGGRGGAGEGSAACVVPPWRAGGAGGSFQGTSVASSGAGGSGGRGTFGNGEGGAFGEGERPGRGGGGGGAAGGSGAAGTAGVDGDDGARGTGGSGIISFGFAGRSGVPGIAGEDGSGGGGGGGGGGVPGLLLVPPFCGAGGGGGGGAGGAGTAARPGFGGGSSIGIAIFGDSDVALTDNLILTGRGGSGGAGGAGGSGGAGGAGGSGGGRFGLQGAGGSGGRGGNGGDGGDAGSGAGGWSIGIYSDDSVVNAAGNVIDLGEPGRGGFRDGADPATRGSDGETAAVYAIEP